jgi:predicted PurR-regulated permease PerM
LWRSFHGAARSPKKIDSPVAESSRGEQLDSSDGCCNGARWNRYVGEVDRDDASIIRAVGVAVNTTTPPDVEALDEPSSREPAPILERVLRHRSDLRSLKRGVLAILVLLVLGVCYLAQEILIPLALALLLSLLLSPVVTFLERVVRIPRVAGSLLTLVAVVAIVVLSVMSLAQPAQQWIAHAPATMQTIEQRFRSFREPMRQAQEASKKIEELTQPSAPQTVVNAQPSLLASMATSTPRALGEIAAVLLLVYFFLSSGNGFLRRMVEIAPGLREKKVVVSIARDVQEEMSGYLMMVSLINFGLGVATAIVLALMGVPNPLLWGAAACLLNFAPYVGPVCTGLALTLVGFTTFDTLGHAFAVPAAFFLLASIEGQLITPTLIGRRLSLDPTVVFVWLLLWGWLWGIVGILLAGPLLACFRIVCQHVDGLRSVGVLIGDGTSAETTLKK